MENLEETVCDVDFELTSLEIDGFRSDMKEYPCGKYLAYGVLNRCNLNKAQKCRYNKKIIGDDYDKNNK